MVKGSPSERKLIVLKVAPFGISPLFYLIAWILSGIRVETIQSNGLPEIQYPYYVYGFFMYWFALGFLVFGVAFSLAVRGGRTPRRPVLGSGLLALGFTVIPLAALVFLADKSEYEQRCFDMSCQPFVQEYSLEIAALSIITFGSIISAVIGARLLIQRYLPNDRRRGS